MAVHRSQFLESASDASSFVLLGDVANIKSDFLVLWRYERKQISFCRATRKHKKWFFVLFGEVEFWEQAKQDRIEEGKIC